MGSSRACRVAANCERTWRAVMRLFDPTFNFSPKWVIEEKSRFQRKSARSIGISFFDLLIFSYHWLLGPLHKKLFVSVNLLSLPPRNISARIFSASRVMHGHT
jgi:hypothetical protein